MTIPIVLPTSSSSEPDTNDGIFRRRSLREQRFYERHCGRMPFRLLQALRRMAGGRP